MLAQDPYSGYYHQIPEAQIQGLSQVLYDGLGNPVGMVAGLFDTLKNIVSNIPVVGGLVSRILPGGAASPAPVPRLPFPIPPIPGLPGFPSPSLTAFSSLVRPRFPIRQCTPPVGWTTSALPYTGTAPRRLYLRCSVWPGQSGMVPTQPGQWGQQLTPQQAAVARSSAFAHSRRRGRHRRRR